jgi:hypothetical protein
LPAEQTTQGSSSRSEDWRISKGAKSYKDTHGKSAKEKAKKIDIWSSSVDIDLSIPSQKERFDLEREAFLLSRTQNNDPPGSFHNDSDRIMFELCSEQDPVPSSLTQSCTEDFDPSEFDNDEDLHIFGRFLETHHLPSSLSHPLCSEGISKTSRLGSLLGLCDQNFRAFDSEQLRNESDSVAEITQLTSPTVPQQIVKTRKSSAVPEGLVRISPTNLFKKSSPNEETARISQPHVLTEKQVLESFVVSTEHRKISTTQPSDLFAKLGLTNHRGEVSRTFVFHPDHKNLSQFPAERPGGGTSLQSSSRLQLGRFNKSSKGQKETMVHCNEHLKKVDISSLFRPPIPPSQITVHPAHVRVNQDASFRLLSQLKPSSDFAAT